MGSGLHFVLPDFCEPKVLTERQIHKLPSSGESSLLTGMRQHGLSEGEESALAPGKRTFSSSSSSIHFTRQQEMKLHWDHRCRRADSSVFKISVGTLSAIKATTELRAVCKRLQPPQHLSPATAQKRPHRRVSRQLLLSADPASDWQSNTGVLKSKPLLMDYNTYYLWKHTRTRTTLRII